MGKSSNLAKRLQNNSLNNIFPVQFLCILFMTYCLLLFTVQIKGSVIPLLIFLSTVSTTSIIYPPKIKQLEIYYHNGCMFSIKKQKRGSRHLVHYPFSFIII